MSFPCPEEGKEAKDAVIHPHSSVGTPSSHVRAFEMPLCQRPRFETRILYFITHPLAENFPWKAQDVRKWWLRPRTGVIALWLIGITLGWTGCTWDWQETCAVGIAAVTVFSPFWIYLSWAAFSCFPLMLDGMLFWPIMTALLHISGVNNSFMGYTMLGIYMAVHFVIVDGFHYGKVEMASASMWFCVWVGVSCGMSTDDKRDRQGSAAILGTMLCAQVMVLRQQRRWSENFSMDNPLLPPPQTAEGLRSLSVLSVVVCIVISMLLIFSGKSWHEVITAVVMTCFSLLRHGFIVDESTSKDVDKSKQHEANAAEDLTSSLLVATRSKNLSDLQHKVSDAVGTWSAMCKIAIFNCLISIGSVSLSMWFGRIPGETRFGAPFSPRGTALAAISVASIIVIICGSNLGHEAGYKWAVIQDPSFRMTSTLKAAQMALKLDVTFRSGLMHAVEVNHTQQACNQRRPTYNDTNDNNSDLRNLHGTGTCAPCGTGHSYWIDAPVVHHNQVVFRESYPMPGSKVIGCDIFGVCDDADWPSCAKVEAPACPSEEFLMSSYDTRNADSFSSYCWTPYVCTPELLCMVTETSSHATRDWWLHNALVFSTASSLMVTVMLTLSNVFKDKAMKQLRLKSQRPKVARAAYCVAWVSSKAGLGFLIIGAKWGPSSILWTHKSESGQHFADARTTDMVLVIAIILGMTSMVTNELARVCEDPKERFSAAESGAGVQAISVVIAAIAGAAVFLSVMTYTNPVFRTMFQIHGGTPGIFTVLAQLGALGVFGSCLVLVWAFTHRLEAQAPLPTFAEYCAKTGWFPEFNRRSQCFRLIFIIVLGLLRLIYNYWLVAG